MATYTIKRNQNIFDVAVQLYGSIEGVFDLLISNPDLSTSSDLHYGQELEYHSDFVLYPSITSGFESKNIIPSGGSRHTYYKCPDEDLLVIVGINAELPLAGFKAAGEGTLIIDWGDNSELQNVTLGVEQQYIEHYFDNEVEKRRIKFYGDTSTLSFTSLDTSDLKGALIVCRPIIVDQYVCNARGFSLAGLALFEGTYSVNLRGCIVADLTPIGNMGLQTLDLTNVKFETDNVLDDYLVYIRENYNDRRPCTVYLTTEPSERGYEAIDTILNEPEWNVSDTWKFYINDQLYIPQNGSNS